MTEGDEAVAADEGEAGTIKGLLARLADDAGRLVRAEVELQRAALLLKVDLAKPAVIALIVFVMLVQAALVAGLVMLAIGLAHRMGILWAGLAVCGGTLLLAALVGWLGLRRLARLSEDTP